MKPFLNIGNRIFEMMLTRMTISATTTTTSVDNVYVLNQYDVYFAIVILEISGSVMNNFHVINKSINR